MIGEPSVGIPATQAVPDFKPITVPVLDTTITDGSVLPQLILSDYRLLSTSIIRVNHLIIWGKFTTLEELGAEEPTSHIGSGSY